MSISSDSPLSGLDLSFLHYLDERKEFAQKHLAGNGLPDYAYSLDYELRKKLDAIPGFYALCERICATYTSRVMTIMHQNALLVTPNQFPEVYQLGRECAQTLGIGVPNIYIYGTNQINAYTVASNDVEPIIVIYSGLYERVTLGELKTIIGHECGHIHNNHTIYNTMALIVLYAGLSILSASGAFISGMIAQTIGLGIRMSLSAWSRAEEVTCDRAGMICADRLEDAYSAEAKLLYGAAFGKHDVNYEEIEKQLDDIINNIAAADEFFRTHPSTPRRLMAEKLFANCDILYQWRPDLKQLGRKTVSKEETDELCKKYINVVQK